MQSKAKTVEEYIAEVPVERKPIIEAVHQTITKAVPDLKPHIVYGMIGYGLYHYKYASGREGDWPIIALANQKNYISVYMSCADKDGYLAENNKNRLGKVSVGKSCIRFKKLEDINLDVLEELAKTAQRMMASGQFAV